VLSPAGHFVGYAVIIYVILLLLYFCGVVRCGCCRVAVMWRLCSSYLLGMVQFPVHCSSKPASFSILHPIPFLALPVRSSVHTPSIFSETGMLC
jgi:hypothetical protein